MESADVVAKRILTLSPGSDFKVEGTSFNLQCFAFDFAMACKHIKDTATDELDKEIRSQNLATESGVEINQIRKITK